MARPRAISVDARPSELRCPLCHDALAAAPATSRCATCAVTYHRACAELVVGCATLGCAGRARPLDAETRRRERLAPIVLVPPPPPPPPPLPPAQEPPSVLGDILLGLGSIDLRWPWSSATDASAAAEVAGGALEHAGAAAEVAGGALEHAGAAAEVAGSVLEHAGAAAEVAGSAAEVAGSVAEGAGGLIAGLFEFLG